MVLYQIKSDPEKKNEEVIIQESKTIDNVRIENEDMQAS